LNAPKERTVLRETIEFGCFLVTALWLLLLSCWPAWMAATTATLLAVFAAAARRRLRGLAALAGGGFVVLAFAVAAIRWLPSDRIVGGVAAPWRSIVDLLFVPLPLVGLFVAVTVLQGLAREAPRAA
jgi:hypothetical protein